MMTSALFSAVGVGLVERRVMMRCFSFHVFFFFWIGLLGSFQGAGVSALSLAAVCTMMREKARGIRKGKPLAQGSLLLC